MKKHQQSTVGQAGGRLEASREQEGSIHTVFEAIALLYPDLEAIAHNNEQITYSALNERANHLGYCLQERGICPGDRVAVKLDKCFDLIVAILGILKAGAVYVPLDPGYPAARLQYMLRDSCARLLLTSSSYPDEHPEVPELGMDALKGQRPQSLPVPLHADALAYLIYTSGTTGNPKGVLVGHAGFINMCLYQIATYRLGPGERVLQFASSSFDASVYEIFIALLSGATLVLVDRETVLDRQRFLEYVDQQQLSFLLLPPVFLNSLGLPAFKTVKTLVTAGEACPVAVALHYSRTKRFFNAYGPTEASVCVSLYQVDSHQDYGAYIPIGKPIPNIRFYLLDEALEAVGVGETGELYIGGIGLAKGYLNQPELSRNAFPDHPRMPGERLYRSGDLARQAADGNLILLGRKDSQVKIRGHRIELGAIAHSLCEITGITNCHVCVLEHAGEKTLCAYYTSVGELEDIQLRQHLLDLLPAYMIPQWFIRVPAFRMTPNGKIDPAALPLPFEVQGASETGKTASFLSAEAHFLEICREVLGIPNPHLSDHFFLLGGHSLKAAALVAKIAKAFGVRVLVSDLYRQPQLAAIWDRIRNGQKTAYTAIEPAPAKPYYATSAAQKRMYMMGSTEKVDVSYNVSIVLQFEEALDPKAVADSLQALARRQEVLRTRFAFQGDELVQQILPDVEIGLMEGEIVASQDLPATARGFVRPFDLHQAPLFRVGYYRLSGGGCALIFDTHHIIADGTSMGILLQEFLGLLRKEQLPPLTRQYKDYAEWESIHYAQEDYFQRHEQFWLRTFHDIPHLKMPAGHSSAEYRDFAGERLAYTLEKETALKLKQFAAAEGVSVYQLLLSVYFLLLSKYSRQQDLVVGTAVANRQKDEVQQMMGMFVNTLALRAHVPAGSTFRQFVHSIRDMVLEAFEYQEYPFERLVAKLGLSGNARKVPLINTLFIVQNIDFFSHQAISGLSLRYENATNTAKFDFSFFIVEQPETFVLEIEYNTSLFGQAYMRRLAADYQALADGAVSAPLSRLEDLSLLDPDTLAGLRHQLYKEGSRNDIDFDFDL